MYLDVARMRLLLSVSIPNSSSIKHSAMDPRHSDKDSEGRKSTAVGDDRDMWTVRIAESRRKMQNFGAAIAERRG
ncbi:hypothetical protein OIU78_007600 [Salix suchowensis]|nr:hypothetical protein OIU78_007600 [Salix suchowensis]